MSEIEYQRKLLGDAVRNAAFHEALRQLIVPDETTVLDIGAGTGFLSFLARRLGARHCTLVEYADTLKLAEELARRNRIDQLSFVQGHSAEINLRRKVDLVISETLGNYALEENLLETLIDARRFLRAGGKILPCALRQFVAPVLQPRLYRELDIWPQIGFSLDYAMAREMALNNMYVKHIQPDDLGGSDQLHRCWDSLDLSPSAAAPTSRRQSVSAWSASQLRKADVTQIWGFALWWESDLVPGITLSTSPFSPRTHWDQIYLPLLTPLALAAGDQVELTLISDTRPEVGVRVSWQTLVTRDGKKIHDQSQDIFRGRP